MLDKWLSWCARQAIERRTAILLTTLVLTVLAALQLPRLQREPSPSALTESANTDLFRAEQAFRKRFGSNEELIVAVVSSPEGLLTREMLGYLYGFTEFAARLPTVQRVDGITHAPFRKEQSAEEATAALTLDNLKEQEDPLADDPELLSALSDVVAAAPERFPMGLVSLSERMQGATYGPLITGPTPSEQDVQALASALDGSVLLQGRLIGKSRRDTLVAIALKASNDAHARGGSIDRTLNALRDYLASHPVPGNGRVQLGGLPVLNNTITTHMQRDQIVLVPATLLVSLLIMVASLRWWAGVLLPLVLVVLTSVIVLGGMALAGVKLTVITNILPVLLIILGLSDSIHLVHRYLEELETTGDPDDSLRNTVKAIGRACFGTSATTAAGMFALAFCQTRMLAEFGIVAGIGVMLAYVTTLLVLPAMLKGRRPHTRFSTSKHAGDSRIVRFLLPLTIAFVRRPWATLLVSLVLTLGAYLVGSGVRVDSALLDQFRSSDDVYATTRLLEREFEGVRTLELSLESERPGRFYDPVVLGALDDVATWARTQKGVLSTFTPVDPFKQAWATLGGEPSARDVLRTSEEVRGLANMLRKQPAARLETVLSSDARYARVRIKLADVGSRATLAFADGVQRELQKRLAQAPDVRATLLGDAYTSSRGLSAVVSDLTGSLSSALLTVFLLVVVSFRSVRYGLLTLPPAIIPLVLTLGWMAIRDIPLNAATAIIFAVSVGITVDGSIHVLARLREELARTTLFSTAMMRTVRGAGEALLVACGALLAGFSVLVLSNFVPVQRFAELIAVSIGSCILTTLMVLPALLKVVGRRFLAV